MALNDHLVASFQPFGDQHLPAFKEAGAHVSALSRAVFFHINELLVIAGNNRKQRHRQSLRLLVFDNIGAEKHARQNAVAGVVEPQL